MRLFSLFILCVLLSACSAPVSDETDLTGTRWILLTLNGHELLPDTGIVLEFESERLNGTAGCNRYGAQYTLSARDGIVVSEGSRTEMLCTEPDGVMEQESEYIDAFWKVNRYQVQGTTLTLANEQDGIRLEYQLLPAFEAHPELLSGKTWQLVSAPGLEGTNLSAFTLRFEENFYRGTTACRDYEGTYQTESDSLQFLSLSMTTEVSCSENDLLAEQEYTSLLGTVWQYNVSETQLELYTDRGAKLVYEGRASP